MSDLINPFHLDIPEADLADLRERLMRNRWPDRETVDDESQGPSLVTMQALSTYWLEQYNWRRCEAALNRLGQHKTEIDGLEIHFLHIRSPVRNAMPLIMTHGWPGSVLEFEALIGPLTDPEAHGGGCEDAFHLVIPSLPGFGFSGKPGKQGWNISRIAEAWITLMDRLGYSRWAAHGGDWGALVAHEIGRKAPAGCIGLHLNFVMLDLSDIEIGDATPSEQKIIADLNHFITKQANYLHMQASGPQTIGYFLAESPIGLAAWIMAIFQMGSTVGEVPNDVFTFDVVLDWITLYWLTATGSSSVKLNWEAARERTLARVETTKISVPIGVSMFPKEVMRSSRRWLEARFDRIVHFNELDRSGHFAALEVPATFVDEIRRTFATLR